MRGNRAFWVLTAYVGLIGGIISMVYISFQGGNASGSVAMREELGQTIFYTVSALELLAICFIAPSLTAGAITDERDQQTFDLLRTTMLSARDLVHGKLISSVVFIVLLLFAALPLQSFAFLFGGVTMVEFVITVLILFITAVSFSAMGLFFSSLVQRTRVSTILAQSTSLVMLAGLPLILLMSVLFLDFLRLNSIPWPLEFAGLISAWLLIALSPSAASVMSAVMLFEEQSVLYSTASLSNGFNYIVPSPWTAYVLFSTLLTFLLLRWSIYRIQKHSE